MYVKFALPQEDPKRKQEGIPEQLKEQVEGFVTDHWENHTRYFNVAD